ncbi:hypothetical protein GMLC_02660 [Geomonas limicola]|uniref:FecR protein domain-containing protein n=1 Tax=Geomonas limicola TaxID=2740186 RepID=A0A6V8N479_9BACT|nr:FecR domain-containing protein [Geomonas limicola]GFO66687.1 hypothetical protein GMLC_02660 [Geomonas limicola]
MRTIFLLLIALLASTGLLQAADRPHVGLVKSADGEAFIIRDGQRLGATPGAGLREGDVLMTGAQGSLGVILSDDTLLSLGSSSRISIERFTFDPARGAFAMVLRLSRGLIEYLSGKISKLSPGSVHIETPVATLGIRGTHLIARVEP